MPIFLCDISTDASRREITVHGTDAFPLACYDDDLQQISVPWHWHDEYEFIVMQQGRAVVSVELERTTLLPGEGLFINTGRLHSVEGTPQEPCRFISLVFHPRLVGGSPDSVFWQKYLQPISDDPLLAQLHLRPDLPESAAAIASASRAWQCTTQETPGYEFEARSCLSTLVYQLRQLQPAPRSMPAGRSHRDVERIKAMLSFIHARYADEISTQEIAASASICERECLRCFHSAIHTTPIQYLRAYRIERAAAMLLATDLPVSEIGAACGFQEMSYFAKTFRKQRGCTPSEYRRHRKTMG